MRNRSTFRCRSSRAALGWLVCAAAFLGGPRATADEPLPTVASINLCADQLVLTLADRDQVVTVSWLAADPEESLLAAEAAGIPLNYGTAEELLRFAPDVVIAGSYTNTFTRKLLAALGYRVVELQPESTLAEVEANLRVVGSAIGQEARAERLIEQMRERRAELDRARGEKLAAVVVRPGGFTVGRDSLADELLALAGFGNVAADSGLDRWGSLSMETLLRTRPDVVVMTSYRMHQPSLANAVLEHPALRATRRASRTVTLPSAYWGCGLPQSLESAALLQAGAHTQGP